jgi:hypothetical protein
MNASSRTPFLLGILLGSLLSASGWLIHERLVADDRVVAEVIAKAASDYDADLTYSDRDFLALLSLPADGVIAYQQGNGHYRRLDLGGRFALRWAVMDGDGKGVYGPRIMHLPTGVEFGIGRAGRSR